MSDLDQIVTVNITADSKTVSRTGFGTPLLLCHHAAWTDKYRVYTDMAGVAEDFPDTFSTGYLMASAAFAQDPAPDQVVIGRMSAASPAFTRTVTITSATEGDVIKLSVISPTTGAVTNIAYTVLASATTTTVATAVELLIEAVPGIAASSSAAVITVTSEAALGNVWIYGLQNCTVEETTADLGYDTTLTALEAVYDDWYFVNIDSSSSANITDVATWVSTRKKLFFANTDSSGELAGTGTIGSTLKAASNNRAIVLYSANPSEFNGVRWATVGGTQDPGSITYKYKTLIGGTATSITATQRTNLDTDNENYLQSLRGQSWAGPGKAAGGEWIDITHGIDAIEARIQEAVYAMFLNSAKVPHSQKGYDAIANVILGVLALFEGTPDAPNFLVAGTSRVILPAASTITTADRVARQLRNVRFSADLEGAIHFVSIRGVLIV